MWFVLSFKRYSKITGHWIKGPAYSKWTPARGPKSRPWRKLSGLFITPPEFDNPTGINWPVGPHKSKPHVHARPKNTHMPTHVHTHPCAPRGELLISEHYAWAQLWPSAPEADPNIWPARVCISIASLVLSASLHYVINIKLRGGTQATQLEAINICVGLGRVKTSRHDEPRRYLLFQLQHRRLDLQELIARGRASTSIHHIVRLLKEMHCWGERKVFLSQGVPFKMHSEKKKSNLF